jgi:hypothetical protein
MCHPPRKMTRQRNKWDDESIFSTTEKCHTHHPKYMAPPRAHVNNPFNLKNSKLCYHPRPN